MRNTNSKKPSLFASAVLPFALMTTAAPTALAQVETAAETEEVVVTGVRGRPRTVQDSPVPIDVFSEEVIEDVAHSDTLNTLQTLVPSFTVPRAANTTSNTFIRAPSLRGLSADKTLLLMNSRRRHRSASVGVSGTGSQAADAAIIPSIALESVEVLRDGAAAQYGSDAIAGVINFILKDDDHGGSLVAQGGRYYEGDGDDFLVAANIGLPLTEAGFLNLSAQWNRGERTIRANQFRSTTFDAVAYAAANPAYAALVDLGEPLQRTGKPEEESIRFVANAGVDLSGAGELYAFGNYSESYGSAAANYRFPAGGQAVMDNPIRLQDGSIFRFNMLYPAGLRPLFNGAVTDASIAGGYRTFIDLGEARFDADIGLRYGWSKIDYSITETLNPSVGPTSQQNFRASNYVSSEAAANADFAYTQPLSFTASPVVLSFGAEYRVEGFEIRPGEEASYFAGAWSRPDPFDFCTDETTVASRTLRPGAPAGINCASASDPVYNVLSVGSNGITGLPPANSGEFETASYSLYAEAATDITDNWFIDVAARFEDYESFGTKMIGKIATRYEFSDWFALRASAGSGFRAPTAGQQNMTQIAILTVDGIPTNTGLFPASNPVAMFLGAEPLQPEESVNYSVGFTSSFGGFDLTVDAYQIEVTDQVFSTAQITVTPAIRTQMLAAGVPGAEAISSVNFFQNAFDSTVKGVDVVGAYTQNWDRYGRTRFMLGLNYNDYKIDAVNIPNLFNARSIYNFENNSPSWRGSLTVSHDIDNWAFMVRGNLFGPYSRQSTTSPFPIQDYELEILTDMEIEYKFDAGYALAIGARNVFHEYPDRNLINASNGSIYADGPVDWQGGFWYARARYDF